MDPLEFPDFLHLLVTQLSIDKHSVSTDHYLYNVQKEFWNILPKELLQLSHNLRLSGVNCCLKVIH